MRGICAAVILAVLLALSPGNANARDYRPVIFVPGLMGSTLVNQDGEQVWGGYGGVLNNFEQLAFPSDPAKDTIRASGILENFDIAFGFFTVKAYGPMTTFLREKLGGQLNVFAYDWRQSNFASACDLVRFIDKRKALADAARTRDGITLVTHSMGGIVGRIIISYIAPEGTLPTAENPCPHQYNISLFMPIAAPFNGAGQALKTLTEDVGFKWKVIRLEKDIILGVFFTIPSVYELLPRYGNCCRERETAGFRAVDLFSVDTWKRFGWIPSKLWNFKKTQRVPFVEERLKSSRRVQQIIETPLPEAVRFLSIWGHNQSTSTVVTVRRGQTGARATQAWSEKSDGDDTVPELSASACQPDQPHVAARKPCSNIPDLLPVDRKMWRVPNTHLGLMEDERVHKTVLWALNRYGSVVAGARSLEDDEIPDDISPFLMSSAGARSLDETGLSKAEFVNPPETVAPGSTRTVLVRAVDGDGVALPQSAAAGLKVSVRTASDAVVPATISGTSLPGHFGISFTAPKVSDALTIQVRLPATAGMEPRADVLIMVAD
jgi:hypothetical protein